MIVDIGGRQGCGWALDLLVAARATLLIVSSLSWLARKTAELAPLRAHSFSLRTGVADLLAVAGGIDTRTPQGRIAIDVFRTVALFERGSVCHA